MLYVSALKIVTSKICIYRLMRFEEVAMKIILTAKTIGIAIYFLAKKSATVTEPKYETCEIRDAPLTKSQSPHRVAINNDPRDHLPFSTKRQEIIMGRTTMRNVLKS